MSSSRRLPRYGSLGTELVWTWTKFITLRPEIGLGYFPILNPYMSRTVNLPTFDDTGLPSDIKGSTGVL